MNHTMFRPLALPDRWRLKKRRLGDSVNWNFVRRERWYPVGWKFNHQTIARMHARMHYLACHAPEPVQRRWRPIYKNFYVKHFGSLRASVRYINQYSCHSWL